MGKKVIIIIAAVVLFGLAGVFAVTNAPTKTGEPVSQTQVKSETFTYEGKKGQDALTLLKAKTTVEQNASGLVVSINGRKADDKKHEFWAFYVNGKMAEVGSADYVTQDADKIEWKIDTY
jgi:hypothetical protein